MECGGLPPHSICTSEDDGKQQVNHQRQRRAGHKLSDILQFAHARDGIPDPAGLKIRQGQTQQMLE
jgi:hypothetical protein